MPIPLDYERPPEPPECDRVTAAIANANSGRGGGAAVGLILIIVAILFLIDWRELQRDSRIAAIAAGLLGLYLFQDGVRVLRRTKL